MRLKLILFACAVILLLNLVSAEFDVDDYDIDLMYGQENFIYGYLDISFTDVPANSLLTGFDTEMTLKEFLDLNYLEEDLDYTCNPSGCLGDSKITSDILFLDLESGEFKVPSSIGNKTFVLKLDDEDVFSQDIEIVEFALAKAIIPTKVPALSSVLFIALMKGNYSDLIFTWDFGDGNQEISDSNKIRYSYDSIGIYNLTLYIENDFGESQKTVQINVTSPKESILPKIKEYEKYLNETQIEINKLPLWMRDEFEKQIDIENLKIQVNNSKNKYFKATKEKDYQIIMEDLLGLGVPISLKAIDKINPSRIIPDSDKLDIDVLESLGAEVSDEVDYSGAVTSWMPNNLDIMFESKTYYLVYEEDIMPLISYIKTSLIPRRDLGKFYFVVDQEDIKFKEDYGQISTDGSNGIVFDSLITEKAIEFLYPEQIDIESLPFYIFPEFEGVIDEPIICDQDGVCDGDENYKNCREDCSPITWTIFLFLGLLLVFFVIYIVLQEWYKRHYEKHLFPDRNQLFNLINFMNNSIAQGVQKKEIFKKLSQMGWKKESVAYAWKKLHGQRTGMWEVPVFKWAEKKEVKKELDKRKGAGMVSPKPVFKRLK